MFLQLALQVVFVQLLVALCAAYVCWPGCSDGLGGSQQQGRDGASAATLHSRVEQGWGGGFLRKSSSDSVWLDRPVFGRRSARPAAMFAHRGLYTGLIQHCSFDHWGPGGSCAAIHGHV